MRCGVPVALPMALRAFGPSVLRRLAQPPPGLCRGCLSLSISAPFPPLHPGSGWPPRAQAAGRRSHGRVPQGQPHPLEPGCSSHGDQAKATQGCGAPVRPLTSSCPSPPPASSAACPAPGSPSQSPRPCVSHTPARVPSSSLGPAWCPTEGCCCHPHLLEARGPWARRRDPGSREGTRLLLGAAGLGVHRGVPSPPGGGSAAVVWWGSACGCEALAGRGAVGARPGRGRGAGQKATVLLREPYQRPLGASVSSWVVGEQRHPPAGGDKR